jgi:hypothetical protein
MYKVLNSYLFLNKSISIPGLGTIYLETLPSSIDISTKNILPPLYYFRFDRYFDSPDKAFFSYLATHKKMPDYEALKWYTEFSYQLRERINQEKKVRWDAVGELIKDYEGNIGFETSLGTPFFLQPVPARQVIRQNAQHVLLVGDRERTNKEMNEWLHHEPEQKKQKSWWIFPLILAVLALCILFFYFSSNGWNTGSFGNQQRLQLDR